MTIACSCTVSLFLSVAGVMRSHLHTNMVMDSYYCMCGNNSIFLSSFPIKLNSIYMLVEVVEIVAIS